MLWVLFLWHKDKHEWGNQQQSIIVTLGKLIVTYLYIAVVTGQLYNPDMTVTSLDIISTLFKLGNKIYNINV